MLFDATLEIPNNYSPFERGDLFEDPLIAAFRKSSTGGRENRRACANATS